MCFQADLHAFFSFLGFHRAIPGVMDCDTVSGLSLEQLITALLIIINELCHRFRIPLSAASSVPLGPQPDPNNHQFLLVQLEGHVVRCVGGAVIVVEDQNLITPRIAATITDTGEMDESFSEWLHIPSVDTSVDSPSMDAAPLVSRPKSAPLQPAQRPQGPMNSLTFSGIFATAAACGCGGSDGTASSSDP